METILLTELSALAQRVLAQLPHKTSGATLIALVGELGAGKTTFVQALARELGVKEAVQSPTYVLMKRYGISNHPQFKTLVHIDAYRLEKAEEFAALKPEEFLNDPRALVCIEWPERVRGALPAPDAVLTFSAEGASEKERHIDYAKN